MQSVLTYLCKWELVKTAVKNTQVVHFTLINLTVMIHYQSNTGIVKKNKENNAWKSVSNWYDVLFSAIWIQMLLYVHLKQKGNWLFCFFVFYQVYIPFVIIFQIYSQLGHPAVATPTRKTFVGLTLCRLPPLPQRVQWWEHWSVLRLGRLCSALHLWSSWPEDRTETI